MIPDVKSCIEEVVFDAYQHTDSLITDLQQSLLPTMIDLEYSFIRSGRYRYDNETFQDDDHLVLKVEGIRDKVYNITSKNEAIYKLTLDEAVNQGKIYPFLLFVNGLHLKWSDIIVVNDIRYTYLLIPSNPFKHRFVQIMEIKSVRAINLPFNIFYTENRAKPGSGYTEIFRFNTLGKLDESGKVVYYYKHPGIEFREFSFANGDNIQGYDLNIDTNVKLTRNNFFVWKAKQFDDETPVVINKLNLFYMNGDPDTKYKVKCFYRNDVNHAYNILNKIPNIELAKNIAQGKVVNDKLDPKILNTSFDFDLKRNKNYDENIKTSFRYMTSYDSQFLTKIYEMINTVETKQYSGKEIKEKCNSFGILSMLLLKYKQKTTYVMVFHNGLLYKHYSDIVYNVNTFDMPVDVKNTKDDDVFEFVFLKNINNFSDITRYTGPFQLIKNFKLNTEFIMSNGKEATEDYIINTIENYIIDNHMADKVINDKEMAFDDDELVMYSRDPKDHRYKGKVTLNDRSWFKIDYELDKNKNIILDDYYSNKEVMVATKNQFKYCFRKMQKDSMKIRLTPDFMTSLNKNQYMVFVNGQLLNRSFYRLILPERNNVFSDPYIYSRVRLKKGDKVEVIYGPIEFEDLDYSGNMTTEMISITASRNGQISYHIPYPFKLYTYRNDFIVFHNGIYMDPNRYKASRGVMTITDGTAVLKDDQFTFVFIYDQCEEQNTAIYVNEENGIYSETIHIPVQIDGQTHYNLGSDRYIEYLMEGNSIMVLYHGLYVPSDYWSINRYTGVLTFAENQFKKGDFVTVVIYYMPGEVDEHTVFYSVTDDFTTDIQMSDLDGLPFTYHMAIPFSKLMTTNQLIGDANQLPSTEYMTNLPANIDMQLPSSEMLSNDLSSIRNKVINTIKELIDYRLEYNSSALYNEYTSTFPLKYKYTTTVDTLLKGSKTEAENWIREFVTDLIDFIDINAIADSDAMSNRAKEVLSNLVIDTATTLIDYRLKYQILKKTENVAGVKNSFPIVYRNSMSTHSLLTDGRADTIQNTVNYITQFIDATGLPDLGTVSTAINPFDTVWTPSKVKYDMKWYETLSSKDLPGFPYIYRMQTSIAKLIRQGGITIRNEAIQIAQQMIDNKIKRYTTGVPEEVSNDPKYTIEVPYKITKQISMKQLWNDREHTLNSIMVMAKHIVNNDVKTYHGATTQASIISRFPYVDYNQTTMSRLLEEGKEFISSWAEKYGKYLVNNRVQSFNGAKVIENFSISFPFVYYYQTSFARMLVDGKTNTEELAIQVGKKLIDNSEITDKPYEENVGGVIKTETKITAKEDETFEFDSQGITGFPITKIIQMNTRDLLLKETDEVRNNYIALGKTMVDTELSRMDGVEFDITEYVRQGNPIFVMKNGVLMTEGVQYTLNRDANKIIFKEPLSKGDNIYMISYSSKYKAIKSFEHNITIEDPNQTKYDLYNIFGQLKNVKHRFIIYLGSVVLDSRRYYIDKDCNIIFTDTKGFEKGRTLRFVSFYLDEETKSLYTYNYVGSSRYHKIDQVSVPFEPDVFTYDIPYPERADKDSGFIIMVNGEILDPSRYTFDTYDYTITFKNWDDPIFADASEFKFIFMYDDIKTLTVTTAMGGRIEDERFKYNIPVPFPNYFEAGNSILVFDGSVLLDKERYKIDVANKIIEINEDEHIEGTQLRFVYVYNSNSRNVVEMDEDVAISTIRKQGYVMMNKSLLKHPLSKTLFWLFLNGKKVNLNEITNISTNMVRINRDQQSRYNLMLVSHTPENEELAPYFSTYSNYDTLMNNLDPEDLNEIFNIHTILSDTAPRFTMDFSKEALVMEIIRDWYGRSNLYNGDQFEMLYNDPTGQTDVQMDPKTKDYHSMVLDAGNLFSAPLDRESTNQGISDR